MTEVSALTQNVQDALEIARALARLGVPIFLLTPNAERKTGYQAPANWQNTIPDASIVNRWQPGMGLAAVTGTIFDVIDVDPRNGGDISALDGAMPTTYAKVATPSGGWHFYIKSLGVAKGGIGTGLDYQGGAFTPNSSGSYSRGFVFLPPTERVSKQDGLVHPYRWMDAPTIALSQGYVSDDTGHQLAAILHTKKNKEASKNKESYATEVDTFLRDGIPMGQQHYILSRIAWDMVARAQGDLHIMFTLRAILSRSPQDEADPWTDEALRSLIVSARSKVDPNAVFQTWMLEETLNLLARTREEEGLDPSLPKKRHDYFINEQARRQARKLADAEEAAESWTGLGTSNSLTKELKTVPSKPKYIIDGMLGEKHNFLLIGKFKSGKTTLLVSMLRSMLDGHPFLGTFAVDDDVANKKVGIWNGEMDEDDFVGYMKDAGLRNTHRAEILHLRGKSVPFMHNESAREDTIKWLAENNIKIWIIDSLTRLAAWNNINKKDSMDVLTNEIDMIKEESGVECVILLTHTPKHEEEGKETAYGGQELQAWADSWWLLTTDKDKRFLSAEGRKIYLPETALEFDTQTGLMRLGDGDRGQHRQDAKDGQDEVKKIAIRQAYIDFLTDNPGAGYAELRSVGKGAIALKNDVLNEMKNDGQIIFQPAPNGKKVFHYLPGQARD